MATQDKSRQQSSYMPSQGGQQSGGRDEARQQGSNVPQSSGEQAQRPSGERALASRQGTYLGGRESAGGYAGSPFALMRRLTDDMDRMFENLGMGMFSRGWPFGASGGNLAESAVLWSPDIEMYEEQGRLVVEAELPGMRKEDVQVQLEQDAIVISGERRSESRQNQRGRYMSERSYGSFHRVIRLPDGADAEGANATFRDGMLRIDMPLDPRTRGRRLEIGDGREQQQQPQHQQQQPQQPQRERSGGQQSAGGDASTPGASNSAQPNARNDDGAPTG